MNRQHLFLHEVILLLCLTDKQGTIELGTWYSQAVAGAVMVELLLAGRIELARTGEMDFVRVKSSSPLGDPLIDECLRKIRDRGTPDTLQNWVSLLATTKDLKTPVALELCRKGILRADEDKVLLIFSRRVYPEVDPLPERALIEKLREAIFREDSDVDPRTTVLVALAARTGILAATFGTQEVADRKDRIERITKGHATSAVTDQATKAAVDAAMGAFFFLMT